MIRRKVITKNDQGPMARARRGTEARSMDTRMEDVKPGKKKTRKAEDGRILQRVSDR